jgi:hypothetical protein
MDTPRRSFASRSDVRVPRPRFLRAGLFLRVCCRFSLIPITNQNHRGGPVARAKGCRWVSRPGSLFEPGSWVLPAPRLSSRPERQRFLLTRSGGTSLFVTRAGAPDAAEAPEARHNLAQPACPERSWRVRAGRAGKRTASTVGAAHTQKHTSVPLRMNVLSAVVAPQAASASENTKIPALKTRGRGTLSSLLLATLPQVVSSHRVSPAKKRNELRRPGHPSAAIANGAQRAGTAINNAATTALNFAQGVAVRIDTVKSGGGALRTASDFVQGLTPGNSSPRNIYGQAGAAIKNALRVASIMWP